LANVLKWRYGAEVDREIVSDDTHDGPDGSWRNLSVRPARALGRWVSHYSGWYNRTPASPLRRHVPGLAVPLILMAEPGFEVNAAPERRDTVTIEHAFLAGLHDSYAMTRSAADDGGIQVNLSPLAARAILGLPMSELTGLAIEAGEVLGPGVRVLTERIRDLASWEERFEAVDAFLVERLAEASPPDPGVSWAYRDMVRTAGRVPVSCYAEALGWSNRKLVTVFRDQVGLAPKTLARVARFDGALQWADAHPAVTWAEVAAEAGYYDQPHLTREFVALAGIPPGELRARTLGPGGGVDG
jgi:AraC-like DNA-binding protein